MTEEIRDTHYSKQASLALGAQFDRPAPDWSTRFKSSLPIPGAARPNCNFQSVDVWTSGRAGPYPSQCGPLFDDEIAVKFRVQGHDPLVRHEGAHLPIARQACLDALDDPVLALLSRGLDQHRRSRDPRPFVLRKHHLQRGAVFRSTGISAEELCQVIYVFERLVCTLAEVLSSIA